MTWKSLDWQNNYLCYLLFRIKKSLLTSRKLEVTIPSSHAHIQEDSEKLTPFSAWEDSFSIGEVGSNYFILTVFSQPDKFLRNMLCDGCLCQRILVCPKFKLFSVKSFWKPLNWKEQILYWKFFAKILMKDKMVSHLFCIQMHIKQSKKQRPHFSRLLSGFHRSLNFSIHSHSKWITL